MHDRRTFLASALAATTLHLPAPTPAAAESSRDAVVRSLLARNREKRPGGARGGANHLSMGLLALSALEASTEQLATVGERWLSKRTEPFPTGGPAVDARNWRQHLGDFTALPGLRGYFTRAIAAQGIAGTLRAHLPELLPGLTAAEFHCMIRTAYGVRHGDPDEVAIGLAYWAAAFLPLGPLAPPGRDTEPLAVLSRIRATPALAEQSPRGAWATRMKEMSQLPGFTAAASSLRTGAASLPAIARAMARLYLATNNDFAALHTVTGTHAYRIVTAHLPDPSVGDRHLWQALVAYYIALGTPNIPPEAPAPLPTWSKILAAAKSSHDDHAIKLADTSWQEFQLYKNPNYARIAAFRLKLT